MTANQKPFDLNGQTGEHSSNLVTFCVSPHVVANTGGEKMSGIKPMQIEQSSVDAFTKSQTKDFFLLDEEGFVLRRIVRIEFFDEPGKLIVHVVQHRKDHTGQSVAVELSGLDACIFRLPGTFAPTS